MWKRCCGIAWQRSRGLDMAGFDTHIHSTASDGQYTPSQLVELAKEKGLLGLALTDHDTVAGHEEARRRAAELDIPFIPGIELSAELGERDVHILGYWINGEKLLATGRLQALHSARHRRVVEIVRKLDQLGMKLDLEQILSLEKAGRSLGRPHVAQAMVEAGYVGNIREAFLKWLGRGMPAFVPREKLSPQDAVALIKKSDGVPVIAHPGTGMPDSLIYALHRAGIGGIEVYHTEHNRAAEQKYLRIARKLHIAAMGGSDFHAPGIRAIGCRVTTLGQLEILSRFKKD